MATGRHGYEYYNPTNRPDPDDYWGQDNQLGLDRALVPFNPDAKELPKEYLPYMGPPLEKPPPAGGSLQSSNPRVQLASAIGRHGYSYFNPTSEFAGGGEGDGPGIVIPREKPQAAPRQQKAMGELFVPKLLPVTPTTTTTTTPTVSQTPTGSATSAENDAEAKRNAIAAAMMRANPLQRPDGGSSTANPSGVVEGYPLDPNLDQSTQAPTKSYFDDVPLPSQNPNQTQPVQTQPVQTQPVTPTPIEDARSITNPNPQPYSPTIDNNTPPSQAAKGTAANPLDNDEDSPLDLAAPLGAKGTAANPLDNDEDSPLDAQANPAAPTTALAAPVAAPTPVDPVGPPIGEETQGVAGKGALGVATPAQALAATVTGNIGAVPGVTGVATKGATTPLSVEIGQMLGLPTNQQELNALVDQALQALENQSKGFIDSLMDMTGQSSLANQALDAMTTGWAEQGTQDPVSQALDAMGSPDQGSFGVGFGGTSGPGFGAAANDAVSAAQSTGMASGLSGVDVSGMTGFGTGDPGLSALGDFGGWGGVDPGGPTDLGGMDSGPGADADGGGEGEGGDGSDGY